MIGLFLVTHGTLGEALIQCVCHVLDKRPPLLGQLGLSASEDPDDALPLAHRMIAMVNEGDGVTRVQPG
jgi:PTS system ascorbate-specific IIA component